MRFECNLCLLTYMIVHWFRFILYLIGKQISIVHIFSLLTIFRFRMIYIILNHNLWLLGKIHQMRELLQDTKLKSKSQIFRIHQHWIDIKKIDKKFKECWGKIYSFLPWTQNLNWTLRSWFCT